MNGTKTKHVRFFQTTKLKPEEQRWRLDATVMSHTALSFSRLVRYPFTQKHRTLSVSHEG